MGAYVAEEHVLCFVRKDGHEEKCEPKAPMHERSSCRLAPAGEQTCSRRTFVTLRGVRSFHPRGSLKEVPPRSNRPQGFSRSTSAGHAPARARSAHVPLRLSRLQNRIRCAE